MFHVVFLYIPGLIKAIQLDYSEAHKHLLSAIRKAPQHTAVGFKQHVRIFPELHIPWTVMNYKCQT